MATVGTPSLSPPGSGRKKRSFLWSLFTPIDKTNARCDICDKKVPHSSNTTNLRAHLASTHPKELAAKEAENKKVKEDSASAGSGRLHQMTVKTSLASQKKFPDDSQRAKDITKSLTQMVAVDMQPMSIVADAGFKNFVKVLEPRYNLPGRKGQTQKHLPKLYKDERSSVRQALDRATCVTLTTDIWTSRATQAYLTVTAHFINEEWKMQSYTLDTVHVAVDHTADNIADVLTKVVEDWGIANKIQAVVTDNGANMVKAVRIKMWKHIPCYAHSLNLVVKDSIKADDSLTLVIEKCSAVASYFHHSTKAAEMLKKQQALYLLKEKKLKQSVETRWNSVLHMMKSLTEQQEAVQTALVLLGKANLCMTDEQWTSVSLAIKALEPFEEMTKEVSAEKYVTISKIIPLMSMVQKKCVLAGRTGNTLAARLAENLKNRFPNREQSSTLAASTYLDPRFKHVVFSDTGSVEAIKSRLISDMQKLDTEQHAHAPVSGESTVGASTSPVVQASDSTTTGLWHEFDLRVQAFEGRRTVNTDAHIQMRRYTEDKVEPRKSDPLRWWKKQEVSLPLLSKLAKKHLGVVASSVPSERLFSKAGTLISQKRNRLKPKNVNMLLFLSSNLKVQVESETTKEKGSGEDESESESSDSESESE